jgi:methylated-DNA-protein-cysteine methyltransferase related protein
MDTFGFRERVFALVAQIPSGQVMTYGDIAAYCGEAHAARIVGGIAHFGPVDLPWHRVVNRVGDMAAGYHGGKAAQQIALEAEGVPINNFQIVDFASRRWRPSDDETTTDDQMSMRDD